MTNNNLSIERIGMYANDKRICNVNDEIREMARRLLVAEAELQEYRKASSDPVAWQFYDDGGWHNGSNHNNHRENTERAGYRVRELYARAAPPLQAVTVPDGWTGSDKANAALIMLDRIETTDPVDDDRIEGIKRIVRELAAAPQPPGNPLQLSSTTEAAPVLDSTTYITMPNSTLKWPE